MSFTQSVSLQLASLLMLFPSIGVSPLRDKLLLLLLPIQLLLLLPLWTGSASAARDPFKGTSVHGEVSNAIRYHLIQCHLQNYKKTCLICLMFSMLLCHAAIPCQMAYRIGSRLLLFTCVAPDYFFCIYYLLKWKMEKQRANEKTKKKTTPLAFESNKTKKNVFQVSTLPSGPTSSPVTATPTWRRFTRAWADS